MTQETSFDQASVYTDFSQFAALRKGAQENNPEALKAAAKQFEGILLQAALKSMRKANESFKSDLLDSDEKKYYQDMFDQQLATSLSNGKSLGLADVLVKQLSKTPGNATSQTSSKEVGKQAVDMGMSQTKRGLYSKINQANLLPVGMNSGVQTAQADEEDTESTISPNEEGDATSEDTTNNVQGNSEIQNAQTEDDENDGDDTQAENEFSNQLNSMVNWIASQKGMASETNSDQSGTDTGKIRWSEAPNDVRNLKARRFKSAEEFVKTMLPYAQKAADILGTDPKVLVAQAALETGWGRSIMKHSDGTDTHNLFGIKADKRWDGDSVTVATHEYRGGQRLKENWAFRSYDSYEDCFKDYANFLKSNPRYQKALEQTGNPNQFTQALQKAGYATDPSYSNKIMHLYDRVSMQQQIAKLYAKRE